MKPHWETVAARWLRVLTLSPVPATHWMKPHWRSGAAAHWLGAWTHQLVPAGLWMGCLTLPKPMQTAPGGLGRGTSCALHIPPLQDTTKLLCQATWETSGQHS